MTDRILPTATAVLSVLAGILLTVPVLAQAALQYPQASRGDHVDHYFGIAVADPYRALEDIDSRQTRAWVSAEAKLTSDYLAVLPHRAEIARRLKTIWNFERWSAPQRYGASWFYTHNDGLQNQAVLFVTSEPTAKGRVLLDPNTFSRDGTVSLRSMAISADGRLLAYALSEGGSDWQIWHVREVATGKDLPDTLRWSKAGDGSWLRDGTGFYYTLYDAPRAADVFKAANRYQTLYFHKLGTPQSQDVLAYTRSDDPDWFVNGTVS
ncbi:MAG TPA: hypothetical protein VII70_02925, partial [Steroidobacteraceae bacterium]